jgi:hypothetical protein
MAVRADYFFTEKYGRRGQLGDNAKLGPAVKVVFDPVMDEVTPPKFTPA